MRDYLNELNEKQYEAVTSDAQYLRIVAGAGSGKTRVLTYRIAYLIEQMGVRPFNILAITFTNKVAKEMKERAIKLIDRPLGELSIKTFHSFCAYFLRREIHDCLNFPTNYIIYDEVDAQASIKKACAEFGINGKDPLFIQASNFIYHHKGIGNYPQDIKKSELHNPIEEKFLDIFKTYEYIKNNDNALDFDDLILKTLQILRIFPSIRNKWQSFFSHILIDEFQDTNDLQYELVKLLLSPTCSLYVVGDPDQTIYTWRGANQNIILNLNKTFPSLKTVILDVNYRSTKNILNVSNKLIKLNKLRVEKALVTKNPDGNKIHVFKGFARNDEADWVIKNIISLKSEHKDFSYNDVAVLYRNSFLSQQFENKFMTSRIPYVIYGGVRFYERKEIKIAISYLRCAYDLNENFSVFKIINEPKRKIGESTVLQLQEEISKAKVSVYQYIKNIENYDTKLKTSTIVILKSLFEKLEYANKRILDGEATPEILKDLLDNVGLFDYLLTYDNGEERVQNVEAFYDQMIGYFKNEENATLKDFLENISLASAQDEVKDVEKIRMMTIHTAKGLEFKYVFVVGLNEEIFPSKRTLLESPFTGLEEERRLCYVAFTRAKQELYVSCNQEYSYVYGSQLVPSRFFKEAELTQERKESKPSGMFDQYFNNVVTPSTTKFEQNFNKTNKNIEWKVGNLLYHSTFGEGVIIDIINDILVINFDEAGVKKILANFKGLQKIERKEIDA